MFHEDKDLSIPVTDLPPAIYRRHDGSKRCTIDLRIQHGMQAIICSNAKSCEVYWVNEHGGQEYQGSTKAELTPTMRWEIRIAAKVGLHMLHGLLLHVHSFCLPEESELKIPHHWANVDSRLSRQGPGLCG